MEETIYVKFKVQFDFALEVWFSAQKNSLIEMVLLSTHNICFGLEIRKIFFRYALLTKVQRD